MVLMRMALHVVLTPSRLRSATVPGVGLPKLQGREKITSTCLVGDMDNCELGKGGALG